MPLLRESYLRLTSLGFGRTVNLRWLYLNRVLRDLSNKLVYFFLPIFLYQLGQEHLAQWLHLDSVKAGFLMIIAYFLIVRPINAALVIPLGRLVNKIGYSQALAQSYFFKAVSFVFMYLSVEHPGFILVAGFFDGMQGAMFWPNYQAVLSKQSNVDSMGKDLGLLHFILQFVAAISPALAGLLVFYFGFDALFLVGVMVSLMGLITALMMDLPRERDQISFREFRRWAKERKYIKFGLAVGARYVTDVALFLWPLYLFILLQAVDKVGYLYTTSLFISMILTAVLTFKIDKIKSRKLFKFSGGILAIIWLIRLNLVSVWGIALVDAFDRIVSNFHWLFFDVTFYKRGVGSQAHSYFVYSELIQHTVMSLAWLLAASLILSGSIWSVIFIVAAVSTALTTLIQSKHE